MIDHDRIIDKIKLLELNDKFEAGLIFGSHARGGTNEDSDIDTIIITTTDRNNIILHPYINNIKLDLSFYSFNQLNEYMENSVKKSPDREPMIAGCKILFDKTGRLRKLVKKLNNLKPQKWTKELESEQRFLAYHANDKVVRNLEKDSTSSLLSMSIGINDLLKMHYLINEKWWLSNKKLLSDLKSWDVKMYKMLEEFLNTSEIKAKYKFWKEIYQYILSQIGGFKPLNDDIPQEFSEDIKLITG